MTVWAHWWNYQGREILTGPLEPYFWKPANDNQLRNDYERSMGVWRSAASDRKLLSSKFSLYKDKRNRKQQGTLICKFTYALPTGAILKMTYYIDYCLREVLTLACQFQVTLVPSLDDTNQLTSVIVGSSAYATTGTAHSQ